jgi:hypothetical protein
MRAGAIVEERIDGGDLVAAQPARAILMTTRSLT